MLWWQAPTILNPHLAIGVKDDDGSRLFYEPLVSFDPEGNLLPVLAAEVPTIQNGMIARDGRAVTVKLKKGVQWHDGSPSRLTTSCSPGSTPPTRRPWRCRPGHIGTSRDSKSSIR